MRIGIGLLHLPPRAFWAMTPRELAAVLAPATAAPSRDRLAAMMRAFPDERRAPRAAGVESGDGVSQ